MRDMATSTQRPTQKQKPSARRIAEQKSQGKMSERLLDFAQPLLEVMEATTGTRERQMFEQALTIATTIWNASVFDQRNGDRCFRTQIEQTLLSDPQLPDELRQLFAMMMTRKAQLFPDDERLVGDVSIRERTPGDFNVRVEARL